jgi:hypothetical protein
MRKPTWKPDLYSCGSRRSWTRSDGLFCISAPHSGRGKTYELDVTDVGANALNLDRPEPICFPSLQEAQDASLWSRRKLIGTMRKNYEALVRYVVGKRKTAEETDDRRLSYMVEDALKEDFWRQWKKARQAA